MVNRGRHLERQAGYNLVFLIVFFSLLSVAAAATLPAIKKQIQREKEAELIFRGLQIAEGIRVFQQRFGRYPNALDELLNLEPRSIRQLWTDPMVEDGAWAYVLAAGQGGDTTAPVDAQGRNLAQGSAPSNSFRVSGGNKQQGPGGPILGVVSRKKGLAIRTFLGKSRYEEWRFTANILPKPQVIPGTDLVQRAGVENLGKPFPRGLQPPGLGAEAEDLAGGQGPTDLLSDDGDDG